MHPEKFFPKEFESGRASLEFLVLANVRGDHSFDLLVVQHQTKTPIVNTTIV